MRNDRIPLTKSIEYDALTGWRQYLHFRPGQRKLVRRTYNKRVRKLAAKRAIAEYG